MSDVSEFPIVIFPDWYDDRAKAETPLKGWLSQVVVEVEDGSRYPVSFIDPVRLQQDMEEYAKQGTCYFSEPGLIVLSEVTTNAVRQAVVELWRQGYFEHLKPLGPATSHATGAKTTDAA